MDSQVIFVGMARHGTRGSTPLEQYRNGLNEREHTCVECGYEDDDGGWRAVTNGGSIYYQRVCPQCESEQTRQFTLSR